MNQLVGLLEQGNGVNILVAVSQLLLAIAVGYWLFKPRRLRSELWRAVSSYGNKVRRRRLPGP